jgi:hypothetical protein
MTTTGAVTLFTTGITAAAQPFGIVAGPDGNLWFTEFFANKIGRITTAGVVTVTAAGIEVSSGAGVGQTAFDVLAFHVAQGEDLKEALFVIGIPLNPGPFFSKRNQNVATIPQAGNGCQFLLRNTGPTYLVQFKFHGLPEPVH